MALMYSLVLPPGGILDVRRAAAAVGDDARDEGVDCRTYFSGSGFLMRLEGDGDPLDRLAKAKSGGRLLASLREHAWFDDLAKRLDLVLAAGTERSSAAFTAILELPVRPGHDAALLAELRDVAASLERAPPMEFWHGGGSLVLYFELQDAAPLDDVLHGAPGTALQRVLHEHTGFSPEVWRQMLAVDQDGVRLGVASGHNHEPAPAPEGTWVPGEPV